MIQVEASQVVLIGLALATVLAHDQAGNGFEYLAGTHDGPGIQLRCIDRALTGGCCDAHEIGSRVLHIGDVSKRARSGDDDISAERERQHGVRCDRGAAGDSHGPTKDAEVE